MTEKPTSNNIEHDCNNCGVAHCDHLVIDTGERIMIMANETEVVAGTIDECVLNDFNNGLPII